MRPFFAFFVCLTSCFGADVLTHHNGIDRAGAVLDETQLTPKSVREGQFGRLFSLTVEGQIFAQPLFASELKMPDGLQHNVLFVATMRNDVYAFDADGMSALPLWHKNLGLPLDYDRIPKDAGAELGQYNIRPYIGVTSTPVIDRTRGVIYVVAKIANHDPKEHCEGQEATDKCPVVYRIHSMRLDNGDPKTPPVDIRIPMKDARADDVARRQLQRPALLLANDKVYVAFGAHQDATPYQGWVISFDPDTLAQLAVFSTTPSGDDMGGIWQAGSGLAADSTGIYFMTGNQHDGKPDGIRYFGDSFVKLGFDLKPLSWFAPANVVSMNKLDIDLGSSGPMLLPGTNELVGGGKQGKLYLLDRTDLGGQQKHRWFHDVLPPPIQAFQAARRWRLTWLSWLPFLFHAGYHHIHGAPVYWNNKVYVWPEEDNVKAFRFDGTKFNTTPIKGMMGNKGMPGGNLSISANGDHDGVLWGAIPLEDDAFVKVVRGTLRAFDAETLKLLWSSDQDEPDDNFDYAKYVPPTVANGKVYLPTFSDRVNVYGLGAHPPPTGAKKKVSKDANTRGHRPGGGMHGGHH